MSSIGFSGYVPCGSPFSMFSGNFSGSKSLLEIYGIHNVEDALLFQAVGESLSGIGIHHGDNLLVHTTRTLSSGDIVIARVNGELTAKRLKMSSGGEFSLLSENAQFNAVSVSEFDIVEIVGVVVCVMKAV